MADISTFTASQNKQKIKSMMLRPFILLVIIPLVLFSFYQLVIASPRYLSQAQLIIKEPDSMSTLDPAMALLTGFGVGSSSSDTELVKAFVYSNDMLQYLESNFDLRAHYTNTDYDMFSRLDSDASTEDLKDYYKKHIEVVIDDKSQVISVQVQAFQPEFAMTINQAIVNRAEWYINEISHRLAEEQLSFVKKEFELVDEKLRSAKSQLLGFQQRHNLLDPTAEGMAFQQITYGIEAQIAAKRTQLHLLRNSMSANAPLVIQARSELESMEDQLSRQRGRLTQQREDDPSLPEDEQNLSVSQLLAKFGEYKIDMELALNAYMSSQISLEKSRIEAYRQLKFLVTVESSTLAQDAKYPDVTYNIALFFVLNILLFGIGRILLATVNELRR
ncbi:lipopolysaccharide biosynthesis protein [Brumicola nitratireducens]|uniref:Lipopolysaccharide biosynthesis n=1 Tax=Glaciecola nitratireducens (strain JCM 12485 / KCTC 12276 / FR1064) TaxID=1085623 RepID=G4QIR3_GLANF|nr:lipopolysaccharide biosynthesis protein [Glaciecola nitratireducens]AEP31218.1 lipopolysaccharide biosynthesis [Glaciecola nitratireducens FR1064]